jgi:isoaspartyl peptidase/L-asparaginase-like protein (Ntn-hydrolase superfamily)
MSSPATIAPSSPSSSIAFVALHAGAGIFSAVRAKKLELLFTTACNEAFSRSSTVEEAVMNAISVLEASPLTNAGVGSSLTEEGVVECEASIMLGNGSFGSVGAVSGVDSAIQVAFQLAKERNEKGLLEEMGRIRPIMMVGDGAYRFAVKKGLPVVARQHIFHHHITVGNKAKWVRYKAIIDGTDADGRVDGAAGSSPVSMVPPKMVDGSAGEDADETSGSPSSSSPELNPFSFAMMQHGTVGAIACDFTGQVCAGVSSGGIWMKQSGRIGSSALIGCGCHAENGLSGARDGTGNAGHVVSVACSISGCGEDITEELMAVRCCDELKKPLSQDSEGAPTHLHAIMRQLVVKNEHLLPAAIQSRKRSRNAAGSTDTQINDDGHITGVISLRVETAAGTALKLDDGAGEPLKLQFCFAHTAPHFALAYASRASRQGEVMCKAWVSMQSEAEGDRHDMKTGEVTLSI